MTIIISGDTGVPVSPVTGTLAVANGGTGVTTSTGSGANVLGTSPSISGAVMSTMASSVLTSGTSQASTSGTSIDFTSIPSWVKRITVMFNGVSTNSTSIPVIQLGSTTFTTTGYTGAGNTNATVSNGTVGILLSGDNAASYVRHGNAVLMNITGNTWVGSAYFGLSDSARVTGGGGSIALGGTLDRVRITTVNGTDTFDAGSINILYE